MPLRARRLLVSVTLRLPPDLLEAIDETADAVVLGRSLLCEKLLRHALDEMDL